MDSLYSIVQMPRGIPVGTLAIGKAGAANAALLAAQILAQHDAELHQRIADWRKAQTDEVLENPDPRGRYEASLRSRQRATGPNAAPCGRTAGYRRLAGWSDAEPTAVPVQQSVITAEIERWPETALTRELARHPAFVNRDVFPIIADRLTQNSFSINWDSRPRRGNC